MTTNLERAISRAMHEEFDTVQPSAQLRDRCAGLLRDSNTSLAGGAPSGSGTPAFDKRRAPRWVAPVIAAAVVATVVITTAVIVHNRAGAPATFAPAATATATAPAPAPAPAPAATTMSARPTPVTTGPKTDLRTLCSEPTSRLGRFWIVYAEPYPHEYEGTVTLAGKKLPALSIYTSGGPPGVGVLCVTNLAGGDKEGVPLRGAAVATDRPIAYFAADYDNIPYLAVAPGITKVTITSGTSTSTYTQEGTGEIQLQPLDKGWHVVTMGGGFAAAPGPMTARAYDSAGKLLDTREL